MKRKIRQCWNLSVNDAQVDRATQYGMAFSGVRSPRDSTPMGFLDGESGISLGYIPVCEYALRIFWLDTANFDRKSGDDIPSSVNKFGSTSAEITRLQAKSPSLWSK